MADDATTGRAVSEIRRLHREFERWFAGESDDFGPIEAAFSDDFTFVAPNSDVMTLGPLLDGIRAHHGDRLLRIQIEQVAVRQIGDDSLVATYEEWHDHDDYSTARQSTVVFGRDDGAANGLLWRHVHETWKVPPPGGGAPPSATG